MKTWKYYNHALLPVTTPNECPDLSELQDKDTWNYNGNKALLARWTTNFDCGYETNWWYCIKDDSFNINSVKSKIRYYIKRGIANFDVKVINACDYKVELYNVQVAAFSAYPESYRPTVNKERFLNGISKWNENYIVFGAFERENGMLQGYSLCHEHDCYVELKVQKTNPTYEKLQINAALVNEILEYYNGQLTKGFYLVDGERNIFHETAFQDYLERYFGFRKAYCNLHIKYRRGIGLIIKILYPLRRLIARLNFKKAKLITGVLRMEEISRKSRKYNE